VLVELAERCVGAAGVGGQLDERGTLSPGVHEAGPGVADVTVRTGAENPLRVVPKGEHSRTPSSIEILLTTSTVTIQSADCRPGTGVTLNTPRTSGSL